MKLQPDQFDTQTITGSGAGWVRINADEVRHSVLLGSAGERIDWQCERFEALTAEHFAQLATFDVELVIFGSGDRLRFPPPAWLQPLMARHIGLESMDTLAACRTYNILAGEGRSVLAALLVEPAPQDAKKATISE